jgi:transcriptional regulator with XRE-family HTH domain
MSKSKSSATLRRDFGRWLCQQRQLRGMTQRSVAEKAHLTATQLSRIENGHSSTRRDTVIHLARIIGIDETAALRQFAPEGFLPFPEELENIPFYEFDKQDWKEIAAFLNFKLSQKRAVRKGETVTIETPPSEDSHQLLPYRVEDGRLISDTEKEKKDTLKKSLPNKRH